MSRHRTIYKKKLLKIRTESNQKQNALTQRQRTIKKNTFKIERI